MKKSPLTGIFAFVALIFLAGCQPVHTQATPESVFVRTVAGAPMPSTAGIHRLTIDATCGWTATPECEWISVTPGSGKRGVCEVTLSFQANDTGADRVGIVRFTAGSYSDTYTLEQSK